MTDPETPSPMPPGKGNALVIVDYANVLPRRVEDEPQVADLRMQKLVGAVIDACGPSRILVRLYGGWDSQGQMTDGASRALLLASRSDPFPISSTTGIVHGRIELATSLLSVPDEALADTYRSRSSIPRLRLRDGRVPSGCEEDSSVCPAAIVKRFTSSNRKQCPLPDCSIVCGDAFLHREQKMVDTHMAMDLVFAAEQPELQTVIVVSGDSDIVPSMLQATLNAAAGLVLVSPSTSNNPSHLAPLRSRNVTLVEVDF